MKRIILLALSILLLPSALVAALSAEAPPAVPVGASATPELCASSAQAKIWATPDFGAFSDCTATCWDGSTRTCNGTSCNAVDSACSVGQQGHCWSNAEGYKYCDPCPTCPGTSCEVLNGQRCKYSGGSCYYGYPPDCAYLSCNCFEGHYVCP